MLCLFSGTFPEDWGIMVENEITITIICGVQYLELRR